MNTRYITEQKVAELTGLALSTLRNDRARAGQRRLPYIKLGKSVRYLESDVVDFMERHRVAVGRGAK
jgi:predicted DNA-binding transcriptional regulator AlpA